MERCTAVAELRARIAQWRKSGERIALVPTMGNLHAGHLALVAHAREQAERVVVSIFVNPLQFDRADDLKAYPRTLDADAAALQEAGAHLLFAPPESEVYPYGPSVTRVAVAELSDTLEGASRPGHFAGVTTVVAKLFNMVQPDVAVFGEKDFQQLMLIRQMVADLDFPVKILGLPTVRAADGLALSSRNGYLTAEEREQAPALYRVLCKVADAVTAGDTRLDRLELQAGEALEAAGFRPDYVTVRRARDLEPPEPGDVELVVLAAAWLGRARLIDNIPFRRPGGP